MDEFGFGFIKKSCFSVLKTIDDKHRPTYWAFWMVNSPVWVGIASKTDWKKDFLSSVLHLRFVIQAKALEE